MNEPDFYEMAAWLHEYDLASKREGWLITNDSDNNCCIARLDDPLSMYHQPGWPQDFTEPKFAGDDEAVEFVRRTAEAGSQWHARAIAIHDAGIPLSQWLPDPTLPERILECCSPGPWWHGLYQPGFSANSQQCIYGEERKYPLAMLDEDDEEANANVVVLAASYELVEELGLLLNKLYATGLAALPGKQAFDARKQAERAILLLSRIYRDLQVNTAKPQVEEEAD